MRYYFSHFAYWSVSALLYSSCWICNRWCLFYFTLINWYWRNFINIILSNFLFIFSSNIWLFSFPPEFYNAALKFYLFSLSLICLSLYFIKIIWLQPKMMMMVYKTFKFIMNALFCYFSFVLFFLSQLEYFILILLFPKVRLMYI